MERELRENNLQTSAIDLVSPMLGAKTLLGAKGIATRRKDATRGKGHRY